MSAFSQPEARDRSNISQLRLPSAKELLRCDTAPPPRRRARSARRSHHAHHAQDRLPVVVRGRSGTIGSRLSALVQDADLPARPARLELCPSRLRILAFRRVRSLRFYAKGRLLTPAQFQLGRDAQSTGRDERPRSWRRCGSDDRSQRRATTTMGCVGEVSTTEDQARREEEEGIRADLWLSTLSQPSAHAGLRVFTDGLGDGVAGESGRRQVRLTLSSA